MMSEDLRRFLHPDFRTQTFVWLAFQAAVAGCYFAARIAGPDWGAEARVEIGFAPAFYAMAAALAIVSRLQQRRAFADERLAEVQALGFAPGAQLASGYARRDGFAELDVYDRSLLVVFAHVRSSYLVTWILQAAVAILGLVLAFAAREMSHIVVFSLAAFGLLFTTRPRAARHLERAARLA